MVFQECSNAFQEFLGYKGLQKALLHSVHSLVPNWGSRLFQVTKEDHRLWYWLIGWRGFAQFSVAHDLLQSHSHAQGVPHSLKCSPSLPSTLRGDIGHSYPLSMVLNVLQVFNEQKALRPQWNSWPFNSLSIFLRALCNVSVLFSAIPRVSPVIGWFAKGTLVSGFRTGSQ